LINVLIIDDSALIREFLTDILNNDNDINVVSAVSNAYKATEILNNEKIDVIILDIDLPLMDGITFLEKIMNQHPLPVIIISGMMEEGSKDAIKALQLGALEIIIKDKIGIKNFLNREKENIINSIKNAASANIVQFNKLLLKDKKIIETSGIKKDQTGGGKSSNKIIAIGASTGGTIVLRYIISRLPEGTHGIVITQHMPEFFTNQFSISLNLIGKLHVKEAVMNDKVSIGNAIVARGNYHLEIVKSNNEYLCSLNKNPPVNRHRPSVDVMFKSIVKCAGANTLGILLTGMGKDGAEGLKTIKEAGGTTVVQDEKSCTVFGMPKAAIDINAAQHVLDIDDIVKFIKNW